jgi:hypothetical protein
MIPKGFVMFGFFKFVVALCFIIILFFLAFMVFYSCATSEIPLWQYQEIKKWSQETPEINTMVEDAMKDGVITRVEYNRIESFVDKAKKKKMKLSIKEDINASR